MSETIRYMTKAVSCSLHRSRVLTRMTALYSTGFRLRSASQVRRFITSLTGYVSLTRLRLQFDVAQSPSPSYGRPPRHGCHEMVIRLEGVKRSGNIFDTLPLHPLKRTTISALPGTTPAATTRPPVQQRWPLGSWPFRPSDESNYHTAMTPWAGASPRAEPPS